MILDDIAAKTRERVAAAKTKTGSEVMRRRAETAFLAQAGLRVQAEKVLTGKAPSFREALAKPGLSFICEVKKASPSRGIIVEDFPYLDIARTYEDAGADAVSVLTEPDFFLGSDEYLADIARTVHIPVLRKDFIIDPYQIYEAKVLGAQAVLLIAALLEGKTLSAFLSLASQLGLAALTEVHNETELEMVLAAEPVPGIIGINNRNLFTFEVDLAVTENLKPRIPPGLLVVAESGVHTDGDVKRLASCGVDALLVGERFMRAADKKTLLRELRAAGGRDEN